MSGRLLTPHSPLYLFPQGAFQKELPAWSTAPAAPYDGLYAELFDQPGVILETKHLSKARGHAFGRNVEWCDCVLPKHASISRQHGAIIHTKLGPVAIDLFSSHGTFLNGARMQAGRPYLVYEGDILRFGAAAGQYKLKGTGREKRSDASAKPEPIGREASKATAAAAAGGGAKMDESGPGEARDRDAKHLESATSGDKRRREHDSSSSSSSATRKDQKGESGARVATGLADPKTGRIRCSHLLVKHAGSRRPSSWREETITISKDQATDRLAGFRSQLENLKGEELAAKFEKLAEVNSDCSSAKHHGDLGFFQFAKMQAPFSKAAFALKVGELSGMVETDSGVHIILRKE